MIRKCRKELMLYSFPHRVLIESSFEFILVVLPCFINNFVISKAEEKAIMLNTENEIWKPVPHLEQYYEVSNLGRVKSLPRTTTIYRLAQLSRKDNPPERKNSSPTKRCLRLSSCQDRLAKSRESNSMESPSIGCNSLLKP